MLNVNRMRIKNKILSGYVVMAILCGIVGVLSFNQLGPVKGLLVLIVALATVAFGVIYGNYVAKDIAEPIEKVKRCVDEYCLGHLSPRSNLNSHDEIGEMGRQLDHFIGLIQKDLVGAIDKIAEGDLSREFEAKDPADEIAVILQKISKTIIRINTGMDRLITDVSDGKLDVRGDEHLFNGIWGDFIANINKLIVAFVNPINVTSDYIDRISKGDIPPKITEEYRGDFNIIKNNLNHCIDIVNGLLDETGGLISAAQQGELDKRGDALKFSGSWSQLVGSVNRLIETIVKPIHEVAAVMQEVSKGNLEVSVQGKYQGEFANLGDSVNMTIEKLYMVVTKISDVLEKVANGDVTMEEMQRFDGSFENISISVNKIVGSLNGILSEIHMAAEQVSTGSLQVADGSQLLAQGATEQASSIEELTASVTQVAAQTKENATNANQANQLVVKVKTSAEEGNHQMGEMLEAMNEINEASANISKVIKVIDDMAFQTNILALNAAVEAARAGQHGKGFAVVAEEVRNLAARSANAAKETTALIEGSIQRAKRGEEIANETAKALHEIVDGVSEAAGLIGGIAVSSNEQASGISQINIGINQVSQVVQTNSATSEESAAASEELSSQAELLKELVNHFKLKNGKGSQKSKRRETTENRGYESRDMYQPSKPQIILSDSEFGKY